jgi:hypothetical protein
MVALHSSWPVRTVIRQWPPSSWRKGLLLMLKTRSVCLPPSFLSPPAQYHRGSSLHYACLKGHKAVVSLLLEKGAAVDTQDKVCVSPSLSLLLSPSAHRAMVSLHSSMLVRGVMRQWPPSSWRGGLLLMLSRSVSPSLPPSSHHLLTVLWFRSPTLGLFQRSRGSGLRPPGEGG